MIVEMDDTTQQYEGPQESWFYTFCRKDETWHILYVLDFSDIKTSGKHNFDRKIQFNKLERIINTIAVPGR